MSYNGMEGTHPHTGLTGLPVIAHEKLRRSLD